MKEKKSINNNLKKNKSQRTIKFFKNSKNQSKLLNKNETSNKHNELIISYDISKITYDIKIFDDIFVFDNQDNCKLIVDGKEMALCENITKNDFNYNEKNKILEIKLIETKKITNFGHMFFECKNLLSISDSSEFNTINITNMSAMFYDCISLISLPDISKWNTTNLTNIMGMFKSCRSLKSLPDISKWNTSKVTNMSCLFLDCSSLVTLPDISKWDLSNTIFIDGMFYDCKLLSELPDISKWNTQNVTSLNYLFYGCESLSCLPDISKWNVNKLSNICWMFGNCISLVYIPDIAKWNINYFVIMKGVFDNCISLLSIPDISKWNICCYKYIEREIFNDNICHDNNPIFKFGEWERAKGCKIQNENNEYKNINDKERISFQKKILRNINLIFIFLFILLNYKIYNCYILK